MSRPATATPALSGREVQVLELLAEGATYDGIAHRLHLSPHTVDTYLRRIRSKTGATNRVQLALFAFSHGHGLPPAS
ncbi:response regulator transcription factor [Streptomyces sp. NPDC059564]|uniref:response regulator transcription factor n=1 Tax=Streptomyces sp. NPDC059564 TaxID=3346865 RepID=UPI0036C6A521